MQFIHASTGLFERAKKFLVILLLLMWMAITAGVSLKTAWAVYTVVSFAAVLIVLLGVLIGEMIWGANITRQKEILEECRALIKSMHEKIPPGQLESEQELSANTIKDIKGLTTRLHKIIYDNKALRKEKQLWRATELVYRELRERTRGPQLDGLTVQSLTRELSKEIDRLSAELQAR